jgi:uncharacterized membrane protein YfcA
MHVSLIVLVLGFLGGTAAGLFGVGGGVVFIPALGLAAGLSQFNAQATSLAIMVPVAVFGAWRQSRYGNIRWRPALTIGCGSVAGVTAGAIIAASLPDSVLRKLFGVFLLFVAGRLLLSLRSRRRGQLVLVEEGVAVVPSEARPAFDPPHRT